MERDSERDSESDSDSDEMEITVSREAQRDEKNKAEVKKTSRAVLIRCYTDEVERALAKTLESVSHERNGKLLFRKKDQKAVRDSIDTIRKCVLDLVVEVVAAQEEFRQ